MTDEPTTERTWQIFQRSLDGSGVQGQITLNGELCRGGQADD